MVNIAGDAAKYVGAGYVFGGVPANGIGQWDCSSFVNWVLGNDLNMGIPGYPAGSYHGQSHGPVVLDYATWNGASTHSGNPLAGDLCVWPGVGATGHIGIAVDGSNMVSALNTSRGTVKTPIQGYGPAGVAVIFRSIAGNSSAGTSVPTGCLPATSLIAMVQYAIQHRAERGWFRSRRQHFDWQSSCFAHYPIKSGGADTDNGSLRFRPRFLARPQSKTSST